MANVYISEQILCWCNPISYPSSPKSVLQFCRTESELSSLHSPLFVTSHTQFIMAEEESNLNNAVVANYLKKVSPEIAREFQVWNNKFLISVFNISYFYHTAGPPQISPKSIRCQPGGRGPPLQQDDTNQEKDNGGNQGGTRHQEEEDEVAGEREWQQQLRWGESSLNWNYSVINLI